MKRGMIGASLDGFDRMAIDELCEWFLAQVPGAADFNDLTYLDFAFDAVGLVQVTVPEGRVDLCGLNLCWLGNKPGDYNHPINWAACFDSLGYDDDSREWYEDRVITRYLTGARGESVELAILRAAAKTWCAVKHGITREDVQR